MSSSKAAGASRAGRSPAEEPIAFDGEELAGDLLPCEAIADCAATVLDADGERILSYGGGAGYTPLRELLAARFGVHPYRVVLTNGLLQGLSFLATDLVDGRKVVVELPTYDRALALLFWLRSRVLYLDPLEGGVNVDGLEVQLRTTRSVALAYLIPTFQNPTGRTLPVEQRASLLELLAKRGALVVEDDAYGELRFEGDQVPTLFELSGGSSVYATSFSHTLGLRVGVFVVPEALAGPLAERANATYISPSLLSQATVFEFMSRGLLEPHLERLRAALRERRDAMLEALARHLPEAAYILPHGGMFVRVELGGRNVWALADRAEGVRVSIGAEYGGFPDNARLNFAAVSPERIEVGVERLARALKAS